MEIRKTIILGFLLFFGVACQQDPAQREMASQEEKTAALATVLPGTWETVSIQVKVNSAENISDSTYLFAVNEEQWMETFGIRPSRTFFEPENRYRIQHRNLADSLVSQSRGMWNVFGDSLMMVEPTATYHYYVSIQNGLATFQSGVDWDADGWDDDEFIEVKRKISVSTE